MIKEHIPSDPEQSFRFFSWENSLDNVQLNRGDGTSVEFSGMGNVWHYHPEFELTLFTEGEGIRYIGDDVRAFDSPDLVLLGSNLPHYWATERSAGYCMQFSFDPSSPLSGLHESGYLKDLLNKSKKGLKFSKRCRNDVLALIEECKECAYVERLAIFLKILHRLSNARTTSISAFVPQGLSGSKSAVVKKAVQYIVENAGDENLELQQVLDKVNMSRATFSRHFQRALGQSYTQFVQSIRLETARNMLAATDKPITEIAFASGFSNLSHFNSLFKKRWSMSPKQLRSSLQK